jgi:DNA-binding MarR family transcriptional regulator
MDARLPTALTDHVGYLSVVMGQRSQERFERAMATLELRPVHYDFLAVLAESGPMTQKQLADLLKIDAARIVSLTDELQQRGLVERAVDPRDRRRNLLSLTKDGRATTTKAARLGRSVEKDLLSQLSATDQADLRRLLRRALDFG